MISGKAKLAGVIGHPIGHSKSPLLHGYWLREHGIDGAYVPMNVAPEALSVAIAGLRALGFRGCNVTVPHKEAVIALCDTVDDGARAIGAVNTLVFDEAGHLHGSNTDGTGFMQNLREGAPGWRVEAGPALVLGAGGAARAIVHGLLAAGAPEVVIANRTLAKAEGLARDVAGAGNGSAIAFTLDAVPDVLPRTSLLVNTTVLGMSGQAPLTIDLDGLPGTALVTDIVYSPLETDLLKAASRRGNPTVDGLGMLLHQAVPGFEAWFGVRPSVSAGLRDHVLQIPPRG